MFSPTSNMMNANSSTGTKTSPFDSFTHKSISPRTLDSLWTLFQKSYGNIHRIYSFFIHENIFEFIFEMDQI